MPLNCGRKWHYQRKSDLSSEVKGQRRADGLARKVFGRLDMKIRAGRMQAVTKDITPCNHYTSRCETESAVSNERQCESSSNKRSGVIYQGA